MHIVPEAYRETLKSFLAGGAGGYFSSSRSPSHCPHNKLVLVYQNPTKQT